MRCEQYNWQRWKSSSVNFALRSVSHGQNHVLLIQETTLQLAILFLSFVLTVPFLTYQLTNRKGKNDPLLFMFWFFGSFSRFDYFLALNKLNLITYSIMVISVFNQICPYMYLAWWFSCRCYTWRSDPVHSTQCRVVSHPWQQKPSLPANGCTLHTWSTAHASADLYETGPVNIQHII